MIKNCLLLLLITVQVFAQKSTFHLQNKNQLIQFSSSSIRNGYKHYAKTNDTVTLQQKKLAISQIEFFLDSLHKLGYQDKAPKIIPQSKYTCKVSLSNFQFFSTNTLKNNSVDSVYSISISVNFIHAKTNIAKTYANLYTHITQAALQKLLASYNQYALNYYARSTIYKLYIDLSFAQYELAQDSLQSSSFYQEIDF